MSAIPQNRLYSAQNVSELRSKGLLWGSFWKARFIVPTALLVRVQGAMKDMYKIVEGPSTKPLVLSMVTGSYLQRRRRLTIYEPDEMKFAAPLMLPSFRLDLVQERVTNSFRYMYIFLKQYFTKLGQKLRVWPEELSKKIFEVDNI